MRKVPAARRLRGPCESSGIQAAVVLPDAADEELEDPAEDFESDDPDAAGDPDEEEAEEAEEAEEEDAEDFADEADGVLPEEEPRLSLR